MKQTVKQTLLLLCTTLFFAIGATRAQPINDDFCSATPLTVGAIDSILNCGGVFPYDNTFASFETGEPNGSCYTSPGTVTVWFSFVAPASGFVSVTTDFVGSSHEDTQISVWSYWGAACPAVDLTALGEVACDDDGGTNHPYSSLITEAQVIAGETYYIQLNGYISRVGDFCLEVVEVATPFNDKCTTATAVDCGTSITGESTAMATGGSSSSCLGSQGDNIWYSLVGTGDNMTITANASVGRPQVDVYESSVNSCTNLSCIPGVSAGAGESLVQTTFLTELGETYYIAVGYWVSGNSSVTFDIDFLCSCANTPDFSLSLDTICGTGNNIDMYDILVDITDSGDATTLDISNDSNGSAVSDVGLGVNTLMGFSPADNSVTVRVEDSTDPTCFSTVTINIPGGCPPDNDNCANAVAMVCGDTMMNQTTLNATGASSGSCLGSQGNNVWYSFTGTNEIVTVEVDTLTVPGGGFKAQIDIYASGDGTCGALTCVSGTGGGENPVTATFTAAAGTIYYLSIGNRIEGEPDGNFNIAINCECLLPVFTAELNDSACPDLAVDVDVTELYEASAVNISNSANASTVMGASTGVSTLTGFNSGDGVVTIYVEDADDAGCMDSLTVIIPPGNDKCTAAVPLTVNPTLNCVSATFGSTQYAYDSGVASCTGTPNNDVWFSFTATDTMHWVNLFFVTNIGGTSTSLDMGQELFGDCGGTSIGCSGLTYKLYTGLTIGDTYYLRIYGLEASIQDNTFSVCVSTVPPPPPNDECDAPTLLPESPDNTCGNALPATTYGATAGAENVCGGSKEVWFSYTQNAGSTEVTFEVNNITSVGGGTPSSAVIGVYFNNCGNLALVSCGFAPHSVVLTSSPLSYRISVETRNTGNFDVPADFDLCVYSCPTPDNNFCSSAETLPESADSGCANEISGTTVCASRSGDNTATAGGEVWYAFTPSTSATYNFESVNMTDGSPSIIGIYSGACGSLTRETASVSPVEFEATSGELYYVLVGTVDAMIFPTQDDFTLCTYPCTLAPNNLCSAAVPLTLGPGTCASPTLADNTCTTRTAVPAPTCAFYGTGNDSSGEVWFSVTVPASGEVIIETSEDTIGDNPIINTGLAVYASSDNTCTGTFTQLICNNDFGATDFSRASLNSLTPGDVLFIAAYEYSTNNSGTFNICAWDPGFIAPECEETITFSDATNPAPADSTKASVLITTSGITTITGTTVFDAPCIELNPDFDTNGNEFDAITNGCTPPASPPPVFRVVVDDAANTTIQKEIKDTANKSSEISKKLKARSN